MNKLFFYLCFTLILISTKGFSQNLWENEIESQLKKAGKNRFELEKTLLYFSTDSLKLRATKFLIQNMDIHYSIDYFWADTLNNRIPFNELDYPDYITSKIALEEIRAKYKKITPLRTKYNDLNNIKADILIENIELAFEAWDHPFAKHLSFEDFCEFILPYRVSVEPLNNWRRLYRDKFSILISENDLKIEEVLRKIGTNFSENFKTNLGVKEDHLPRLSALQLLHRKEGACEDCANFEVMRLRALGIPATLNIIPFWATSSGKHFLNSVIGETNKLIIYDVGKTNHQINPTLDREPSKVIRCTYSKQKNTLAELKEHSEIPAGFLRSSNYIDVTDQFWEVKDVTCRLFDNGKREDIVYACVFNYLAWHPTWWAKKENKFATFNKMSKGVIYLPTYYINKKNVPAGYPIAVGYNNELILKPDTLNKQTVKIDQQDKYLIYRPHKLYRLYYWDNRWILIGEQKTDETTNTLIFQNVPKNALLILIPEYSQKKERPFIFQNNIRIWY